MDQFEKEWQRWFPEDRVKRQKPPRRRNLSVSAILWILFGVIALFIILNMSRGVFTEWLWFSNLGYSSVYSTILGTKIMLFFAAAIVFCLFFGGNLVVASRIASESRQQPVPWSPITLGVVILGLIFGLVAQNNWDILLKYFNGQPFGINDPVFNKEISFYVFSLPFLNLVRNWLLATLILSVVGTGIFYVAVYITRNLKFEFNRSVLAHICVLAIAVLALFVWGYWLGIWDLVFSPGGAVFGATYTDIYARLPAKWILMGVVVVCMCVFIVSIWRRSYKGPLYAVGVWIGLAIIVGLIYPAVMQRFQVQPNELVLETPYIQHNIEYTLHAFNLNEVEEQPFPAEDSPTMEDLEENASTINNIRLWDHRPLKDLYNQIQSIRLYYDFNDVDVDRYTVDGQYRQVMLSARELSAEKLSGQAQTWMNRVLQFTHGYGLALSPVTEISQEGMPTLWVKDIPPAGNFEIERPQIYYGEKTNDYVIVNTTTQEFDYPMGEENVYGHYEGTGGVVMDTSLKRFLYSWQFSDFNALISSELTPQSRILYKRNIQERVRHIAPFLELDADPYLVILDGKLFWIQDAYTVSDSYPYSEPAGNGWNYVRNSVKAVIDAYNGKVTFYITDPDDALIKTYQAMFPSLFVTEDRIPKEIRAHFRYPVDLFNIQAQVYKTYHMRDARVFYNKEDLWALPREIYAGQERVMEPYYVIMRLPQEETEEFLLMLPFTPVNKNNTIGWMAARCDGEHYGKLFAYFFPKDTLVYGPSQIENRIQQDTVITEQFALWGRGGSRIIRGNLLMIPLEDSRIYVEPVFLQAEAGGLPELKRVIVAIGEKIVMEPTLAESIASIYGLNEPEAEGEEPAVVPEDQQPSPEPPPSIHEEPEGLPESTDVAALIKEAQLHFDKAQEYLKEGNWTGYGQELSELKEVLDRLAEISGQQQ